jgi:hypothetical protein
LRKISHAERQLRKRAHLLRSCPVGPQHFSCHREAVHAVAAYLPGQCDGGIDQLFIDGDDEKLRSRCHFAI